MKEPVINIRFKEPNRYSMADVFHLVGKIANCGTFGAVRRELQKHPNLIIEFANSPTDDEKVRMRIAPVQLRLFPVKSLHQIPKG